MYDRDFSFQYFGFKVRIMATRFNSPALITVALSKTLERAYLLKINGVVHERPQQMFMRVAIGIHGENIDAAIEVSLSTKIVRYLNESMS